MLQEVMIEREGSPSLARMVNELSCKLDDLDLVYSHDSATLFSRSKQTSAKGSDGCPVPQSC